MFQAKLDQIKNNSRLNHNYKTGWMNDAYDGPEGSVQFCFLHSSVLSLTVQFCILTVQFCFLHSSVLYFDSSVSYFDSSVFFCTHFSHDFFASFSCDFFDSSVVVFASHTVWLQLCF